MWLKKSIMWEKPAIYQHILSVFRGGFILERKKYILCSPQLLVLKTQDLCLFSLIFLLHNQTHNQLVQTQWVSDVGKEFITLDTPNDFHFWFFCFKFMKLPICIFIFSSCSLHFYKKGTKCYHILEKLHEGALRCRQWRCAAGHGPQAHAERVIYQLMGKWVSSIKPGFFPFWSTVPEMFTFIKMLCAYCKTSNHRLVWRKGNSLPLPHAPSPPGVILGDKQC